MPSALAIFAHPDDIEFVAAGTLLMLAARGWRIHYFNLCDGCCGSVETDAAATAAVRLAEARHAAGLLGAVFHPPLCHDLELTYSVPRETWLADKVSIWQAGTHDNPLGQRLTAFMISKGLADSAVPMSLLADHPDVQFNYYRPGLGSCSVEMH